MTVTLNFNSNKDNFLTPSSQGLFESIIINRYIDTLRSRDSWISCKPVGCVGAISKTVYHLNFLDVLQINV